MVMIGLGNPGPEYEQTRHNAGFLVLEAARRRWRGPSWKGRGCYQETEVRFAGQIRQLVRPLTFMNCSGEAVRQLLKEGAAPDELLVVLDDVDLPLGRLRIRAAGGAGGHNGLQSILDELAPSSVARLRIGVGRPDSGEASMVDHVLAGFCADEAERFERVLDRALEAMQVLWRQGVTAAMNRFNGLPAPWDERPAKAGPDGLGKKTSDEVPKEGN